MWLIFSLLAGLLFTLQGLLARFVLKGDRDAWAFSFYFSLVGAVVSLPFMVINPKFSSQPVLWVVLIVVGALIVLQNYLSFKSTSYLEASVQGALSKLKLLWVLLMGVIFLGESLTVLKVLGTGLTVAAGIIVYSKTEKIESKLGVILTLVATLVYTLVIGLYKLLFAEFNSSSLTFLIFAIPTAINFICMPQALQRIKNMAFTQGREVLLATFLGGLANLAMNQALSLGEASRVLVIIESFLIIVLLGEHIVLKEQTNLTKKAIAVVMATVGAILILYK